MPLITNSHILCQCFSVYTDFETVSGILKRETYYGKRFTSKTDLIKSIESYIRYYNTERIQRKLHLMTPVEYHENYYVAA